MTSLQSILQILSISLNALSVIPVVGPEAALAETFLSIIQKSMAAYQTASGQPLDLTKLPMEKPV